MRLNNRYARCTAVPYEETDDGSDYLIEGGVSNASFKLPLECPYKLEIIVDNQ